MFSWFPLLFPFRQPVAVQVRGRRFSQLQQFLSICHFLFAGWHRHRGLHVALCA
jgi:hypothetical protein